MRRNLLSFPIGDTIDSRKPRSEGRGRRRAFRREVRCMSIWAKWLLAGGLLLLVVDPARGGDGSAAIAKLLDVGWSITPQARTDADLQYEEVRRLAGSDPRALEASWLVLMQQRRF